MSGVYGAIFKIQGSSETTGKGLSNERTSKLITEAYCALKWLNTVVWSSQVPVGAFIKCLVCSSCGNFSLLRQEPAT